MLQMRYLVVLLPTLLVAPSIAAAQCRSAADGRCDSQPQNVRDGGVFIQAEYITREEQRQRAQESLERHRQERNNHYSVDHSTRTETPSDYGRVYQEQQLQGDKPRVVRPW